MVVRPAGFSLAALAAWALFAAWPAPADELPFLLRAELSERNPWERSQVLYSVRIYWPAGSRQDRRIRRVQDLQPVRGEALIERLGEDREYQTRLEGVDYHVLERRYALFPQAPGELLLSPVSLEWIGGESGFRSESYKPAGRVRMDVRAVPAQPAEKWLAAADVRLWEEFERAPGDLVAGEPLIRLLGVRVEGQPAHQIPELNPGNGPNFRHFMERPELEDSVVGDVWVGIRRQRAALLAVGGGDLVLPALALRWWNTVEERWEVAELPQRLLQAQAPPGPIVLEAAEPGAEPAPWNDWLVPMLVAGWFLTAVAWWAFHRISAPKRRRQRILSRFARESSGGRAAVAKRLAALAAACRNRDPAAVESALLAWSREYWRVRPPRNLNELGERCGEPASTECRRLYAALYAPGGGSWDPSALLKVARRPPPPALGPQEASNSALPALWPRRAGENG